MLIIRSHAVATFLIGVGHQPFDVEFHGLAPVFLFSDAAQEAMSLYRNAKELLDVMTDRRRSGGAR
jgi:hypothetical protein